MKVTINFDDTNLEAISRAEAFMSNGLQALETEREEQIKDSYCLHAEADVVTALKESFKRGEFHGRTAMSPVNTTPPGISVGVIDESFKLVDEPAPKRKRNTRTGKMSDAEKREKRNAAQRAWRAKRKKLQQKKKRK